MGRNAPRCAVPFTCRVKQTPAARYIKVTEAHSAPTSSTKTNTENTMNNHIVEMIQTAGIAVAMIIALVLIISGIEKLRKMRRQKKLTPAQVGYFFFHASSPDGSIERSKTYSSAEIAEIARDIRLPAGEIRSPMQKTKGADGYHMHLVAVLHDKRITVREMSSTEAAEFEVRIAELEGHKAVAKSSGVSLDWDES